MHTLCSFRFRTCFAALMLGASGAGSARAQCDIFRDQIPDFDQQWSSLPNNGLMYCVPTSACNLLAYIGANGDSRVFPLEVGYQYWPGSAEAGVIENALSSMGQTMNTDEYEGTGADDARAGLQSYLDALAPDDYTVYSHFGQIFPYDLYAKLADGRLVMLMYGYYDIDTNGNYSRSGGHCVTLTGVESACPDSAASLLRYRDPDDDATRTTQSVFTSRVATAAQVTLPTSSGSVHLLRLTNLGIGSTTLRCADTTVHIRSLFAVYPSATMGLWNKALLHTEDEQVQGGLLAQAPTPNGHPINYATLGAQGNFIYYTTTVPNPNTQTPIYSHNLSDGTSSLLMTVPFATPLATDRFGDLYFFSFSQIKRYDVSGAVPVLVASVTPDEGQFPDALVYDDSRDQLVGVSQSARDINIFDRTLALVHSYPLPAGVPTTGQLCADVAPSQTGYLVASSASGMVYDLRFNAQHTSLDLYLSVAMPGAASIRAIQVGGSGRLYVMTDAGEREFKRNEASQWLSVASPQFGSMPVSNTLLISRGRTNYDPALYNGPGWINVVVPEPTPVPIRDCPADVNMDGAVTLADIFQYLEWFFAGSRAADFNVSGAVGVQDIFDFLSAWFAGC